MTRSCDSVGNFALRESSGFSQLRDERPTLYQHSLCSEIHVSVKTYAAGSAPRPPFVKAIRGRLLRRQFWRRCSRTEVSERIRTDHGSRAVKPVFEHVWKSELTSASLVGGYLAASAVAAMKVAPSVMNAPTIIIARTRVRILRL